MATERLTIPKTPPISWYGGKQRMTHNIVPLIPKHMVYVEPFAGSCAVLFKKPYPAVTNIEHYREVINDTDKDLINFFTVLRDNGEALCEKLALTLYSEEERRRAKVIEGDDLERARRYYVRVMTGFGKVPHAGWQRGFKYRNFAMNYYNKVNALPEYIDRMRHVAIACDDALKVMDQFDSPQTLFYLDPPYINTHQGHYKGYTHADFERLLDKMQHVQGACLLSNYPQPDITYPDNWLEYRFRAFTVVAGTNDKVAKQGTERTECVYYKPRTGKLGVAEQRVYDSGVLDCFTGELVHNQNQLPLWE
jgi:DNA adenine methylase